MPTPIVSTSRKLQTKVRRAKAPKTPSPPKAHDDGVRATTLQERAALPMYQRENALVLGGDALRELGHELGLPWSTLNAEKDDERIRSEIYHLQQRKHSEDAEE